MSSGRVLVSGSAGFIGGYVVDLLSLPLRSPYRRTAICMGVLLFFAIIWHLAPR